MFATNLSVFNNTEWVDPFENVLITLNIFSNSFFVDISIFCMTKMIKSNSDEFLAQY